MKAVVEANLVQLMQKCSECKRGVSAVNKEINEQTGLA